MIRMVAALCCSAVSIIAAGETATQLASLAERTVPQREHGDVSLPLPLQTNAEIERAVLAVATTARIPVGVERTNDAALPPRVNMVHKTRRQEKITGLQVHDALTLIGNNLPPNRRIQWNESDGVLHVSALGTQTFLDARVSSFEANGDSLRVLLARIHRVVDPGYPQDKDIGSGGSMSTRSSSELNSKLEEVERPLTISATNCTIRDVLDKIILTHGSASWIVRYADDTGVHAGSTVLFSTFDGTTVQLGARHDGPVVSQK